MILHASFPRETGWWSLWSRWLLPAVTRLFFHPCISLSLHPGLLLKTHQWVFTPLTCYYDLSCKHLGLSFISPSFYFLGTYKTGKAAVYLLCALKTIVIMLTAISYVLSNPPAFAVYNVGDEIWTFFLDFSKENVVCVVVFSSNEDGLHLLEDHNAPLRIHDWYITNAACIVS